MSLDQLPQWIIQNAIPLFVGAVVASLIELIFKVFIWDDYISPSFRYKFNYYKNRTKKWLHNTPTELSYSSRSTNLESLSIGIDRIPGIVQQLKENNIPAEGVLDIVIENYQIGKMSLSGAIEFSTVNRHSDEIVHDFIITLTTQMKYNTMNDEIVALFQQMGKMKEHISYALNVPLRSDKICTRVIGSNERYEVAIC